MSDLRLYDAKGYDVDEMRAPEGRPTFVRTDDQEPTPRVVDFFFDGVRLLVEDDRLWAYVRARRQPSACTEQYYASVAADDGPIADRVDDLWSRLESDERLVLSQSHKMVTLRNFAQTDPTEPPSFDSAAFDVDALERRLDRTGESDETVRVAAPGPKAAYRALVRWSDRVDSAVVADDTEEMASGEYDLTVELGHDEWGLLGQDAGPVGRVVRPARRLGARIRSLLRRSSPGRPPRR